jgi:uncharacterized protein
MPAHRDGPAPSAAPRLRGLSDTGQLMSTQNVETVRLGYVHYAEGNLEGVTALFSEGVVLADGGGLGVADSAAGTLRGPEGFLRSARESLDAFDDFQVETEDFIDAGDAVVVSVRISGTGKASGARLEMRLAHLWVMGDDGKVILGEVYRTVDEALAATRMRGQRPDLPRARQSTGDSRDREQPRPE